MALNRYLIYMSYIGKAFQGAQRQVSGAFPRADDHSTIQGRLESALKLLNPTNEPVVVLSSRTDSGVHALCSTCHVDLYRKCGLVYDPKSITFCLNTHFKKHDVNIRILKTFIVPNEFHSRHNAISRTYLYRLTTIKSLSLAPHSSLIPIEENDRSLFVCSENFEAEAMRKASELFLGEHDFRTFMGKGSKDPDKITRRIVKRVDIEDGTSLTYSPFSYPFVSDNKLEEYTFYNIYVQANGFLYRQVRRMVAALVAVGQGKLLSRDIKLMLEVPSHRSWIENVKTVPAYGLYLCQVQYSESDQASFRQ